MTEQSKMLQVFLASISKGNALVQMSEEYDLMLKSTAERNKLEFAIGILHELLEATSVGSKECKIISKKFNYLQKQVKNNQ